MHVYRTRRRPLALASAAAAILVLGLGVVLAVGGRDSSGDHAGGASPQGSTPAHGPGGSTDPARPQMDEAGFWQLTEDTRQASGNDTGRQSGLLAKYLSRLPAPSIVDYQRIRDRLDEQAYSWDIWGAGYVIEDGCSEDCFRDFRSYLISLGRGPYEAAMRDPDSIAPVVQDAEQGDWENADTVAPDAYQSATGTDFRLDDSDLSGNPSGKPWDDENEDGLVQRYPRLAARFR